MPILLPDIVYDIVYDIGSDLVFEGVQSGLRVCGGRLQHSKRCLCHQAPLARGSPSQTDIWQAA